MPYFEAGRKGTGGFDVGIEQAVAAVLVSPDFLYRTIRTPAGKNGDRGAFPLSDLELASRLSFFLWSQGPDDALLKIAADGKLNQPDVLEAQARRMLADSRASSLVRNFALKWLNVDNLRKCSPIPCLFPSFNDALRKDFAVEIESFISSVLLAGSQRERSADGQPYVSERTAGATLRHYGRLRSSVPARGTAGSATLGSARQGRGAATDFLRRPYLPGAARRLGVGQTDGDATNSSTARCRHRLVHSQRRKTQDACAQESNSIARKRGCNQCHGVIDPIGLALENFDAIGRWRDVDTVAEAPINAKTVLPNGRPVDGPAQLRQELFGDFRTSSRRR